EPRARRCVGYGPAARRVVASPGPPCASQPGGSGRLPRGGYGTRKRKTRSRSPRRVFGAQDRNRRVYRATYSEDWRSIDCANRKADRGAATSKKSSRIRGPANSARDGSLCKIRSVGLGLGENHL